ncbi:MAG: helix-turn-helix transcriptional regulator [Isosphaeraceae bacterium]|nr:helix-turn-helix transcriptional regulator [Isosphaeraceae bacterium]
MSLAQRVKDSRYAKGWGPDELASRASISRTALYQIESGKTEKPRAGTLRRIAEALNVPTESLLGSHAAPALGTVNVPWTESLDPILTGMSRLGELNASSPETVRFGGGFSRTTWMAAANRERDLERKLRDLLSSPMGESVARIIEEVHRLLPERMEAIR